MLGDRAESARADAARALGGMGRRAKPATPSLIRALEDPSPEVRAAAMAAVVNIRALDDQEWVDSVVDALVLRLSDSDAEIRAGAAEAAGLFLRPYLRPGSRSKADFVLYDMRRSGTGGVQALLDVMQDPDTKVRQAAAGALSAKALVRIGTEKVALHVGPLLKDPRKELRTSALNILQDMDGNAALPALRDLCDALTTDEDPAIRQAAARTLGSLGRYAVAAVPDLRQAMEDPVAGVKREAGRAIRQITAETANALKAELPEPVWAAVASGFEFEPELTQLIRDMTTDLFVSYPDVQWWVFSHPGSVGAAYDNLFIPPDAVAATPHDVSIEDILNLHLLLWEAEIAEVRGSAWLDKARSQTLAWKDEHQRLGWIDFTLDDNMNAAEQNKDPYVTWSLVVVSPIVDLKQLNLVEGTYLVIMRFQYVFD